MSFYLSIPFPERLEDDIWIMKLSQITWLGEQGLLQSKFENQAGKNEQ